MSTADPDGAFVLGVLLSELVDDAALFPPGDAPMAEAVPAHLRHDAGPYYGFLGRFLCPVSKLGELHLALPDDASLPLGLIGDTGLDGLREAFAALDGDERYMLEAAELRHPGDRLGELTELLPYGVEAYVEVAPSDMRTLLPTLAGLELVHAKLRTGGLVAEAFPGPTEVAEFLVGCADLELAVKCTAGLHHAVRHADSATGFTHHGFLNVLLAASAASDGRDVPEVRAALELTDATAVAARIRALTVEDAARTRDFFHGFGSCSFTEPIDDLISLGLVPPVTEGQN
jgi:hypothetical protein